MQRPNPRKNTDLLYQQVLYGVSFIFLLCDIGKDLLYFSCDRDDIDSFAITAAKETMR